MSDSHVKLLIIGGGIGGLTTALALAKRGFDVHVIEKVIEFGEIGAGIQIAPNASRVFDEIGVLAELHSCAVLPARIVWMDMISGQRLTDLDLGGLFIERYTYPYMVLHRSELLDVLLCFATLRTRCTSTRPRVRARRSRMRAPSRTVLLRNQRFRRIPCNEEKRRLRSARVQRTAGSAT